VISGGQDIVNRRWPTALAIAASLVIGGAVTIAAQQAFGGDQAPPRASSPSASTAPTAATDFDLNALLPFNQAQLRSAADLGRRFIVAYGSYRFDESPQSYLRRLSPMAAPELLAQLERGAATPGILDQRKADREVAATRATISAVRLIQKTELIYLITADQTRTTTAGARTQATQYAVTLTPTAKSWLVRDVVPADLGQAGDIG
jgi:hypothetical protein